MSRLPPSLTNHWWKRHDFLLRCAFLVPRGGPKNGQKKLHLGRKFTTTWIQLVKIGSSWMLWPSGHHEQNYARITALFVTPRTFHAIKSSDLDQFWPLSSGLSTFSVYNRYLVVFPLQKYESTLNFGSRNMWLRKIFRQIESRNKTFAKGFEIRTQEPAVHVL